MFAKDIKKEIWRKSIEVMFKQMDLDRKNDKLIKVYYITLLYFNNCIERFLMVFSVEQTTQSSLQKSNAPLRVAIVNA